MVSNLQALILINALSLNKVLQLHSDILKNKQIFCKQK